MTEINFLAFCQSYNFHCILKFLPHYISTSIVPLTRSPQNRILFLLLTGWINFSAASRLLRFSPIWFRPWRLARAAAAMAAAYTHNKWVRRLQLCRMEERPGCCQVLTFNWCLQRRQAVLEGGWAWRNFVCRPSTPVNLPAPPVPPSPFSAQDIRKNISLLLSDLSDYNEAADAIQTKK